MTVTLLRRVETPYLLIPKFYRALFYIGICHTDGITTVQASAGREEVHCKCELIFPNKSEPIHDH